MTESGDWQERVVPKVADETRLIKNSFTEPPDPKVIEVFTRDGGIDFMCAEGEILVREDQLNRVLETDPPARVHEFIVINGCRA